MKSRADLVVFLGCIGAGLFAAGMEVGERRPLPPPPPLQCPTVQGAVVVSSSHTRDGGQSCTYQRAAKGFISQKVNL